MLTIFEKNGKIELRGAWEMYWDTLLRPADFPTNLEPKFYSIPHLWNDLKTDSTPQYDAMGYCTYRLQIIYPSTHEILAIKANDVYTSYQLWLNGEPFSAGGGEGGNCGNKQGKIRRTSLVSDGAPPLYYDADTMELVLQVGNYWHSKGGMHSPFIIGSADELFSDRERSMGMEFLLTGALIYGRLVFSGLVFIWTPG